MCSHPSLSASVFTLMVCLCELKYCSVCTVCMTYLMGVLFCASVCTYYIVRITEYVNETCSLYAVCIIGTNVCVCVWRSVHMVKIGFRTHFMQ